MTTNSEERTWPAKSRKNEPPNSGPAGEREARQAVPTELASSTPTIGRVFQKILAENNNYRFESAQLQSQTEPVNRSIRVCARTEMYQKLIKKISF